MLRIGARLKIKNTENVRGWFDGRNAIGAIVTFNGGDEHTNGEYNGGDVYFPEQNKFNINFIESDFQIMSFKLYYESL